MIQKLDDHDQLALNFRALKAFITVDAKEERWLHEEPEDQVEHVSAVADANQDFTVVALGLAETSEDLLSIQAHADQVYVRRQDDA